jgi:lysophospholipase L1-like esterase
MRITVEALSQMRQRAHANGAEFAILLIPTKELALADAVAAEQDRLPVDLAYQAAAEVRVREALRDRFDAQGIPVIDSLAALQELAANGVLPYSETRDGHLSPSGHRAVAAAIKEAIESGLGLVSASSD